MEFKLLDKWMRDYEESRVNHGNDKIQNKCNEYLIELYNKKYEEYFVSRK